MPEEYREPAGFTDEDRALARYSSFHATGPRKIVVKVLEITASVPVHFSDERTDALLMEPYANDPYIRSVVVK